MMLKRKIIPRDGSGPGLPQRGSRGGSTVFAVFAGVAVVCAGTTAAALANSHASVSNSGNQCQVLPAPPSTPPSTSPPITPGGTNSGTGSSSSSAATNASAPASTPTPTEICVNVGVETPSVHPGETAEYSITVSAEGGKAGDATVQISLPAGQSTPGLPPPTFNICGPGDGTQTCTIGSMHDGQTSQLEAEVAVPSKSSSGGTVILAATVTAAAPGASTTGSATASGTVSVIKAPSTSSSSGHPGSGSHHTSGTGHHGSGSNNSGTNGSNGDTNADNQPFDNLPPLTTDGSGVTSGGDSSDLFPTINPSTGSIPGTSGSNGKTHKPYKASTVADVLPLNTGQISGQVAGLIVLGLGIMLVFARISLRKPRSEDKQ
jgi:Domain of unknown function DUF11